MHVLDYYTLLSLDLLKDKEITTLNTGVSPPDVTARVRSAIDVLKVETGNDHIFYDTDDVPDTTASVDATLAQKTYREAIETLKNYAPADTYWYVDGTGRFSFKPIPTAPTYTFINERHVKSIRVERPPHLVDDPNKVGRQRRGYYLLGKPLRKTGKPRVRGREGVSFCTSARNSRNPSGISAADRMAVTSPAFKALSRCPTLPMSPSANSASCRDARR